MNSSVSLEGSVKQIEGHHALAIAVTADVVFEKDDNGERSSSKTTATQTDYTEMFYQIR